MLFCAAIVFACNSEDLTAGEPLFQIMGQRVTDNSRAVGLDLVGFFTEKKENLNSQESMPTQKLFPETRILLLNLWECLAKSEFFF